MKTKKGKEPIDFCEFCGKDVEPQQAKIIECDLGFYHYPCKKCYEKLKGEKE